MIIFGPKKSYYLNIKPRLFIMIHQEVSIIIELYELYKASYLLDLRKSSGPGL